MAKTQEVFTRAHRSFFKVRIFGKSEPIRQAELPYPFDGEGLARLKSQPSVTHKHIIASLTSCSAQPAKRLTFPPNHRWPAMEVLVPEHPGLPDDCVAGGPKTTCQGSGFLQRLAARGSYRRMFIMQFVELSGAKRNFLFFWGPSYRLLWDGPDDQMLMSSPQKAPTTHCEPRSGVHSLRWDSSTGGDRRQSLQTWVACAHPECPPPRAKRHAHARRLWVWPEVKP